MQGIFVTFPNLGKQSSSYRFTGCKSSNIDNITNVKNMHLHRDSAINIEAVDSKTGSQTQRLSTTNFSKFTAGLPGILQIGQGAMVMLIKNLNVDDVLVMPASVCLKNADGHPGTSGELFP